MVQPPSAPAANRLALRGNYALAGADYTVQQRWQDYSAEEHDVWKTLFLQQIALARRYATEEFLAGVELLGATADRIPQFEQINERLRAATGWRIVAVPGLIPEDHFFAHLAQRSFPVSVWIRERSELDYLSEPDLFHDFFGHVPMLTNTVFARFVQAYGEAGPKARAHGAVHLLARLYWYTVEFGLVRSPAGLRAYGAGIVSSKAETVYSVDSPIPHRVGFDLARIMQTNYRIDDFQRCYFVLDSFEQLFHAGYDTDFAPLYERYKDAVSLAPEQLTPHDDVITQGTLGDVGAQPSSNGRPT
jgi:phenylalanine-4-hydroxylase